MIAADVGADCVFQLRCAATASEGIEEDERRSHGGREYRQCRDVAFVATKLWARFRNMATVFRSEPGRVMRFLKSPIFASHPANRQAEFDAAIKRGVETVIARAKGFRGYKGQSRC